MGETHPTPAENTSELSARLEGKEPDTEVLGRSIDDRMAALLADHQDMGARPTQEPANTDLYDSRLPLRETGPTKEQLGLTKKAETKTADKPAAKTTTKRTTTRKTATKAKK